MPQPGSEEVGNMKDEGKDEGDGVEEAPSCHCEGSDAPTKGQLCAVCAHESHEQTYKAYPSRFYVLLVFSLVLFYQCMIWNTWGPISASALEAFPSWSEKTISTLANWGPIMFVLSVVPTSWAITRWGLRPVIVVFTGSVAVGHCLRCVTTEELAFTILVNVCGIINGVEATMLLASAMLASMWFPAEQRITATAFSVVLNVMGSGGSFMQPLLVRSPDNSTTPEQIRGDIHRLMLIEMSIAVTLFVAVAIYFPSAPPTPPSPSSDADRLGFTEGFKEIVRNGRFWQLILSYAIFTGVSMVWMGVINLSLEELDLSQDEIGWVGFYNCIVTGIVSLFISKLTDKFYGRLKITLLILMTCCSFFYIWFMLLSLDVIGSTKAQVYITVLGGQSFNMACTPLFMELSIEAVYPSSEGAVGTVATFLNNGVAALFLFLFYIPGISDGGNEWVTYMLVGSTAGTILPVLFVKEEYKRSRLDRKELADEPSPAQMQ